MLAQQEFSHGVIPPVLLQVLYSARVDFLLTLWFLSSVRTKTLCRGHAFFTPVTLKDRSGGWHHPLSKLTNAPLGVEGQLISPFHPHSLLYIQSLAIVSHSLPQLQNWVR